MKRFYTILKTELKLSIRGMDMIIFAIRMPLVVIALLGIIFGSRPAYPGAGYTFLEQSFGALTTISICAGGGFCHSGLRWRCHGASSGDFGIQAEKDS